MSILLTAISISNNPSKDLVDIIIKSIFDEILKALSIVQAASKIDEEEADAEEDDVAMDNEDDNAAESNSDDEDVPMDSEEDQGKFIHIINMILILTNLLLVYFFVVILLVIFHL